VIPDENFFKKAVGIACRNAMQSLLPQEFLREMIDVLAEKKKALERGEKPPKKAAPPKETPPAAAAPAAPSGPTAPPAKPGDKTIRQKLFVALNHFEKDTAAKRKLLLELTGKDSSKELEDAKVTQLTSALERALPGKVNELRSNADGSRYVLEKPTGNVLFGTKSDAQAEAPAAAAPAGEEEEEPF
jgi:hypothetical protein